MIETEIVYYGMELVSVGIQQEEVISVLYGFFKYQ